MVKIDTKELYEGIDHYVLAGYISSLIEHAVADKKRSVPVKNLLEAFECAKKCENERRIRNGEK